MRVSHVSLYSNNVEALTFSLSKANSRDQYMVREIVGLDNEEIVPRFYSFGLQSRAKFYDFTLKPRTIVIRVVLNPRFKMGESYSDLRDNLYRAISSVRNGQVVLHFNDSGTTVARIYGFITKFEVPYFTPLPEVQLTIRCDDPMFRAINPVSYLPSEMKTSNPIIVPDSLSTAPHGFTMELSFNLGPVTYFEMKDAETNPDWTFFIKPEGGFLAGDVLHFSSDYSDKYLYIVRSGASTSLINRLSPQSVWPVLFPGATTFYIDPIYYMTWKKFEYYPAYWGV